MLGGGLGKRGIAEKDKKYVKYRDAGSTQQTK